jgi:ubiquinone/menaquinone biosynthesis C-methylase UbiE
VEHLRNVGETWWCENRLVGFDSGQERLLREQVEYYRARATEYDDWFLRLGRYDRGEDATRRWFSQVDEVRRALLTVPLDGKEVLELAPGTGIWTAEICPRASSIVAVDSSPEMIALNRERLGDGAARVTYVEADLFRWRPDRQFDAVVFCFWLSHVPAGHLDEFLQRVAGMLKPHGSVFFLDGRKDPLSTASDHVMASDGGETMTRRLDDGREFTIVKNYWDARTLEEMCDDAGLGVRVSETTDYFQFGIGTRK